MTQQHTEQSRPRIALLATLTSAGILLFFAVAGQIILTAMSIPLSAFQIAGGIVLFLFALSMIFGESKSDEEVRLAHEDHDTAIYPLAVLSIAGPGAMLAAVLQTENARFSIFEQAQVIAVMFAVLFLTHLLMLGADRINRLIGSAGASVVSRVMGLILAAVATTNTLAGITSYFEL